MVREYRADQKFSSSIEIGISFRVILQSDMLSEIALIAIIAISQFLSAIIPTGVQFVMNLSALWKIITSHIEQEWAYTSLLPNKLS